MSTPEHPEAAIAPTCYFVRFRWRVQRWRDGDRPSDWNEMNMLLRGVHPVAWVARSNRDQQERFESDARQDRREEYALLFFAEIPAAVFDAHHEDFDL